MQKAFKAIIGLFIFFFVLFFSLREVVAQANRVVVSPATQSVNVGSEALVSINIAETSNLYGFQFDLTYNSTILEYVSLAKGTFIGDSNSTYWVPFNTTTPGTIKNIAVTRKVSGTVSGSGTLVSVRFKGIAAGTSSIGISNLKLGNSINNEISSTAQNGEVVVVSPAPPPSPTLSVALTANPSSGTAPLSNVNLTATVTGTATGNINYTFYCNRSDSGTNITTGYACKKDNVSNTTYSLSQCITDTGTGSLCSYTAAGTYSGKVIVERESLQAEKRATVTVSAPSPTSPTVDIEANNSDGPITINYNTSATLSWESSNTDSCTASSGWSGSKNTSGTESTGNLTSSKTYILTCTGPGGTASDSVAVNVSAQPTLSVALEANPSSGTAPLSNVNLTATVTGTATGNINYTFYCNRSDSGINITTGYACKRDDVSNTTYSLSQCITDTGTGALCGYTTAGTYSAKVIAERGLGLQAEKRANVTVTAAISNLRLTVSLEADPNPNDNDITITIYESGTDNQKAQVTQQPSSGNITLATTSMPAGTYDILVSCLYHLRKKATNVSLSSGSTIALPALPAGDLNRDNIINSLDWSLMSPKWFGPDPIADLNKDNIVNAIDWSFMNRNWQLRGD